MTVDGTSERKRKYGTVEVLNLSEWGRPFARIVASFLEKKTNFSHPSNKHTLLAFFILRMAHLGRVSARKLFSVNPERRYRRN